MQSAEKRVSKNSLHQALRRYSSAVSDMEQTILLPSLLRDVPTDEMAEESCGDLYGDFVMLKTIRTMVESGLIPLDERKINDSSFLHQSLEPLMDSDPEALLCFHLKGLFSVMNNLIETSQSLTEKYMDIVGVTK